MKVIYIAGPYRGKTAWDIEQNIVAARLVGAEVARLGAMPLIPHSNTSHFDGLMPDQFWLDGTLELLRRCDAVMLVHNWAVSIGAKGEKAEAERLGRPVFSDIRLLERWLLSAQLARESA